MENIKDSALNTAGSELFVDSESFLQDLSDTDAMDLRGGIYPEAAPKVDVTKLLEFGINVYALENIVSIVKTFTYKTNKPYLKAGDDAGAGAGAGGAGG